MSATIINCLDGKVEIDKSYPYIPNSYILKLKDGFALPLDVQEMYLGNKRFIYLPLEVSVITTNPQWVDSLKCRIEELLLNTIPAEAVHYQAYLKGFIDGCFSIAGKNTVICEDLADVSIDKRVYNLLKDINESNIIQLYSRVCKLNTDIDEFDCCATCLYWHDNECTTTRMPFTSKNKRQRVYANQRCPDYDTRDFN